MPRKKAAAYSAAWLTAGWRSNRGRYATHWLVDALQMRAYDDGQRSYQPQNQQAQQHQNAATRRLGSAELLGAIESGAAVVPL